MKEDNHFFTVGRVPTRTGLILFYLVCLLVCTMFFPILPAMLMFKVDVLLALPIGAVFLLYVYVCFLILSSYFYEYWVIKNGFIKQYCPASFGERMRNVNEIFMQGEAQHTLSITLENIQSIGVYWKTYVMPIMAYKSYPLYLNIALKDGSVIKLKALTGKDTEMFLRTIEHLQKDRMIRLDDPDHLIDALKDPNVKLHSHIEKLQREALKQNQYIGSSLGYFQQNQTEKRDDHDIL